MTAKESIGVVGVGRMGLAIVKHAIRHGYAAVAQDVSAKALQEAAAAGARTVVTPAEVGRAARVVVIAVGYDNEAAAVMLEAGGLLETMAKGSVILLCSTCTPDHVRMLAGKAAETGVDLLDAPICRGAQAADAGTMLSLCGGKPDVFARAEPVLRTFCSDVALLGDVGAGQFGKALNNYLLWVNGVALIEAAKLSEANGMDLVKLRDALLLSSGASDALKNWDNVSFTWALKDMQIVTAMADKSNLTLPVAGMVKELVKDGRKVRLTDPPDWMGTRKKGG